MSGNCLRELELPSKRKVGNICPVMEASWSAPCGGRRCEKEAPASPQFHQIPDFFMKLMIALFLVLNLRVYKLWNIAHWYLSSKLERDFWNFFDIVPRRSRRLERANASRSSLGFANCNRSFNNDNFVLVCEILSRLNSVSFLSQWSSVLNLLWNWFQTNQSCCCGWWYWGWQVPPCSQHN